MSTHLVAVGATSPFDIPALQKSIAAVMDSMPRDQRFNLLFDVKRDKARAAIVGRAFDGHFEAIAWIEKPYASDFDFGLQARVNFLVDGEPHRVWFSRLRGYYRLFRTEFMGEPLNDRDLAAWKALKAWLGFNVRMVG